MEKNSKYKLIHYKGSHYIIDLNRNKLTYIFPLLNYVTRNPLIEVKEAELKQILTISSSKEKNDKRKALTTFASGLSILIAITTKSITDYLDFTTNIYINVILLILTILPMLAFKSMIDKNKKNKLKIRSTQIQAYAYILPSVKYIVQNISFYIVFLFLFIISLAGLLTLKHTNMIFVVGIIMTLMFILFQNVLLYAQTKIDGKLGRMNSK
ncbi:DUF443 family protein [Staphylococcus lugdunensis]|nr:hypothetical protein B7467_03700 [Staphylococcus lugdunensis]MBM7134571.1 DUF443 family protein [Staphylococcus lugdunensis]QEX27983.1 DUF443 family protein [Staphylococcus lugdunensis]QEX33290.1 DUF443 family protein [Staphylococcus lugdunensis]